MSHDDLCITVELEDTEITVSDKVPEIELTLDVHNFNVTVTDPEVNVKVESKDLKLIFEDDKPDATVTLETIPDVIVLASDSLGSQGPPGPEGPIGPPGADSTVPGPIGPEGPAGSEGIQGPPGADSTVPGPPGPEGPMGQAEEWIAGISAPTAGVGSDGDWFINNSNGDIYEKVAGVWQSRGNLKGPTGATGSIGPEGPEGPQGDPGPTGATGATGAAGATGPIGPEGPQGDIGPTGATGATGPEGPQGDPGPPGADSTVPGPAGATGPEGPQGDPGPTGATGSPGAAGELWFSGTEDPNIFAPAGANVGDWYLRTTTGRVWEKTSTVAPEWTVRADIKGPQGITGAQGIQGEPGPTELNTERCSLLKSGLQSLPDQSWQVVTWQSAEDDPNNMHTDGSGDIILPSTGYWLCSFYAGFSTPTAVGRVEIAIAVAGTRRNIQRGTIGGSGAGAFNVTTSALVYISSAPTTIQAQAFQALQGTGWGVGSTCRFSAVRLTV